MQRVNKDGELIYKSGIDCCVKLVREEGILSLYRGVLVNVFRSVGGAITLLLYDHVKIKLR